MNELLCPKCIRYSMEHEGNGFLRCLFRDCLEVVHISDYIKPETPTDRFKAFRESIKIKRTMC